jgi:hypothetical protein
LALVVEGKVAEFVRAQGRAPKRPHLLPHVCVCVSECFKENLGGREGDATGQQGDYKEQVNLAEQLTSSDFGVSTGLISQGYWEQSKWYFVNVERGNIADKLQPRNINVSFNNNSNVPIDVIIFTFYSDQLTIDVETGIVTK